MNDTLITVACDKCQTRFRVKPNVFKIMKSLRCTKCGNQIPLVKPADPEPVAPETPPVEAVQAPAPAPSPSPAPVTPPAAAVEAPTPSADAEISSLKKEVETLKAKLKTAEQEIGESDARIASLQELWHGKELEIREMSARLAKAENDMKQAMRIRDEFLAKARSELASYLVGERDAALTRFAELEKKLLSMQPPTS